MLFKNVIVLIPLLAFGLTSGACSSSSPSAPTQLSGSTSSSTTITNGATINGSITGAALSALSSLSNSGFATANGPGLMVTVVGTSITARVNPNGTFVLTNVPPGDIQLRFTGPGTDALLTVTGVTGGDELRITVQVSGNTATLKDVSRKDKVDKVDIEGIVLSGTCASFVVNGTTITTDAATEFSNGTCASVIPRAIVQVKGSTLAGGTVRASEVKFKKEDDDDDDDDDDRNKIELEGLVTAGGCGSFTVRGVVVATNAATVFKNGPCTAIARGVRVHVRATRTAVGTALALLVNIQRDEIDLEGLVTAGGCRSFTVRGVVVSTNAATVFRDGRCADIAVGRRVNVKATSTGAGTALALRVEIEDDDDDDDDDEDDDDDNDDDDRGGSGGRGRD